MNILVYDVAAETGGATTILQYFYEQHVQDVNNHYYYILSTYHLDDTENVTIINEPNVKKSWMNRICFDFFGVRKYVKRFRIEKVISLQNIILPLFSGEQVLYVHNALPFCEYKFKVNEDFKLWIYQNVIGLLIKKSIKKSNCVLVQTEWMREAIVKYLKGNSNKVEVRFPEVDILSGYRYMSQGKSVFFFPANAARFKNHRIVFEACMLLMKQGITNYSVVFTLQGNETTEIREIYEKAQQMGIEVIWVGNITRERVFEYYSKSILLFPSYIETVGLPIYEAKSVGCPMILADCIYSRFVAKDYENAMFFDFNNEEELMGLMRGYILQ